MVQNGFEIQLYRKYIFTVSSDGVFAFYTKMITRAEGYRRKSKIPPGPWPGKYDTSNWTKNPTPVKAIHLKTFF